MLVKLPLKNAEDMVLVTADIYDYLLENKYFQSINFLKHLRLHSSGYAFYQKNYLQPNGKYKSTTIYLHRYLAERHITKPESAKRLFVAFKNGNRLDCRLDNLYWTTSSHIVRQTQKIVNTSSGYRGVTKANQKYMAHIFRDGKRHYLGLYETAEEAAMAYNQKSIEWFGETNSLNEITSTPKASEG